MSIPIEDQKKLKRYQRYAAIIFYVSLIVLAHPAIIELFRPSPNIPLVLNNFILIFLAAGTFWSLKSQWRLYEEVSDMSWRLIDLLNRSQELPKRPTPPLGRLTRVD